VNERPGPHLKGRFFQVRLDYVREYYGYEALAELMAALPERERAQLESLHKDSWYPFRSLNALDRLIAELCSGPMRASSTCTRSSRAWSRSTRSTTTSAA
jgi:hypothetical protein